MTDSSAVEKERVRRAIENTSGTHKRRVRADESPFTRPSLKARTKKRRVIEKARRKARNAQRQRA